MKRIAILSETSLASGRQIVIGVSRFLDERGNWSAFQHSGPLGALTPSAIMQWEGDGMIARIANKELLDMILSKGVPTVDVLGNVAESPLPLVKCDDRAIGRTVARHFLESGYRNFGFIGLEDERWSMERQQGFSEVVEAQGYPVRMCLINQSDPKPVNDNLGWVKDWLASLRTPSALMVASDQFAPIVFEACHQLQLSIPEHMSVVGVDNDQPFCNLCRPRLSSVEPNHSRVGYRAVELLERLMRGESMEKRTIEVRQHTLHQRLSSGFMVVDDEALVKGLNYIREHAAMGVALDEVASAAGLSRSVLQRRFRQRFNRTVGEVILSEKLRISRDLLAHTQLSLAEVAERSGFNCQEYMTSIFRKHLQTTPRKFRGK
ncbi:XylR family transcriptional regulator [Verrucomicrobiaceae bacterium N1E253]|uniref:XylR family transcriptional regulator n=1 Tax=Oceaniferula marina TaxID=2748318 RepID=A0A851GN28_9BACT|nr:XylR family transcriptional regulator [Oceaniferula marina]NWK55524.1 XylR family transcriptional regulator [Oceaniferula marina]